MDHFASSQNNEHAIQDGIWQKRAEKKLWWIKLATYLAFRVRVFRHFVDSLTKQLQEKFLSEDPVSQSKTNREVQKKF